MPKHVKVVVLVEVVELTVLEKLVVVEDTDVVVVDDMLVLVAVAVVVLVVLHSPLKMTAAMLVWMPPTDTDPFATSTALSA